MIKYSITVIILIILQQSILAQTTHTLDSTTIISHTIITGIDIPWEITWGPDDHIWMTERFGRVSRINPSTGSQEVLLDLSSDVYEQGEAGMLGLALHPDFENNPYVYFVYNHLTASDNIREKLVRYTFDTDTLLDPYTMIGAIRGNNNHNGSRLLVTPDHKLLMTTGDAQSPSLPQNISSKTGKVLRINLDGSIPSDNPDPSSLIWSWGHRNAQGLCSAPNGKIYSSEHGPTNDDELNIIEPNRNYGWPDVEGFCDTPTEISFCADSNVFEPILAWTPTIATSDIIWYDHPAIPEWQNKLLLTTLKNKELIAITLNNDGTAVSDQTAYFTEEFGRLRDVCISPNGKVYIATNGFSYGNSNPFSHAIIELSNEDYYLPTDIFSVNDFGITLGPNPLQEGNLLNLQLIAGSKGKFKIYNLMARNILSLEINDYNTIPIHFPQGVYFWEIKLNNGQSKKGKLIIE